jgi:hypothetical protein
MKRVRVEMKKRDETMIERRDRVAAVSDLDPRDQDVLRAKALRGQTVARFQERA